MKILAFLISLLFISSRSDSQIYHSYQDLISLNCDTNCLLKRINDVRVDSLGKRFWFSDRKRGMVKDAFAISFSGQLYLQENGIRQKLPDTFHPLADKNTHYYYPVIEKGRYLYLELLSDDKSPDLGIAMGIMGGVVGNALGTALTDPVMTKSAVIFDTHDHHFYAFDLWKDVQSFLLLHHPDFKPESHPGQPGLQSIHQVFVELNLKNQ